MKTLPYLSCPGDTHGSLPSLGEAGGGRTTLPAAAGISAYRQAGVLEKEGNSTEIYLNTT